MARQRIITPKQVQEDTNPEKRESAVGTPLNRRPQSIDEYLGQTELLERLGIALDAAKKRDDPME